MDLHHLLFAGLPVQTWTACTAIMTSRASERKDNTPQYARRLLRCMIAGFSRCTRLPRKEKPWLVEPVLLSRPLLWAFRALLPMPQQLACSKLRKTSSLSLTLDIQTRIRVKLVRVV